MACIHSGFAPIKVLPHLLQACVNGGVDIIGEGLQGLKESEDACNYTSRNNVHSISHGRSSARKRLPAPGVYVYMSYRISIGTDGVFFFGTNSPSTDIHTHIFFSFCIGKEKPLATPSQRRKRTGPFQGGPRRRN
jgi:hypothetical protein